MATGGFSLGLGSGLEQALDAFLKVRQLRRQESDSDVHNQLAKRQADILDREQSLRESKDQGDKIKEFLTNLPTGENEISPEMYAQIQKEGFAPTFARQQTTLPAARQAPAMSGLPGDNGPLDLKNIGGTSSAPVTDTGRFVAEPFQTPAMKDAELRNSYQANALAERQNYGDRLLSIRSQAEKDTAAARSEANSIRSAFDQSQVENARGRLENDRLRYGAQKTDRERGLDQNLERIVDTEIRNNPMLAFDQQGAAAYRASRLAELRAQVGGGSGDDNKPAFDASTIKPIASHARAGGGGAAKLQDLITGIPDTYRSAPGFTKADKVKAIRAKVSSLGLSPDDEATYITQVVQHANTQR
jgi:hypothetical protein